jgi:hypothetical protein
VRVLFRATGDVRVTRPSRPRSNHCATREEFFIDMETPLPVKVCKVYAYGRLLEPLSREGSYRATPAVTRASIFPVSSEGPPHSFASYDTQYDVNDLFLPGYL